MWGASKLSLRLATLGGQGMTKQQQQQQLLQVPARDAV